ncbi:anaerobic ribonucleoside-triphosphate reductase activating protein [Clostridium botulinum]|uniref:anaerobic ribonucleoside-triphosphate reductase activating protein n=2 Tax=Clostridium botulinum TaxID=1491 RepID=UPI00077487C6|nr:anaerobic ribonucleoside-triphosphate reductase activating protein [Clostridium botulinum]MBN3367069.1 anaerobic ribonucleoside-triphosphate reductase activating protein [Clostridium botulinum]MBN3371705.1 anaerobic ribonucleoside-triphosphate reductase activating protein [Clostridium botulinum]MBN3375489.1 anaerobic ribonucleoside-triphosphate reductase activating protein [Clostridium botulinum]MBN3384398.1 anaerobic ribonucleoside-triphosphate reductase activating protein [Clostridium botu
MSKYINIVYFDDTNANGYSITIFLSGCSHKCEGCHNPSTWNSNNGENFDKNIKNEITNHLRKNIKHYDAVVFSGGDPLNEANIKDVLNFSKIIKNEFKNIKIWIYTGYDLDYIKQNYNNVLKYVDYIKCGTYNQKLKTNNNIQYGIKLATSNQRIYKKGTDY